MAAHLTPFHLAIPVLSLSESEHFYGELLGCSRGRSSEEWIDWNFYGHQLVTHKVASMPNSPGHNAVDNKAVPVPHFGVILALPDWHALSQKLTAANCEFVIDPYVRFAGEVGEQATMFLLDPSGNALEFKAFADMSQIFEK
jgi:extradiol dioxygenase family protein